MGDRLLFETKVPLAPYTTLGLGGDAAQYVRVQSDLQLREALQRANSENLPILILGGGSNLVIADSGFHGLVIHMNILGQDFSRHNEELICEIGAGVSWDDFVESATHRGAQGIECLSGIPGSVGATPIQNVGAYGQEVAEVLVSVTAMERKTPFREVTFHNSECDFAYRHSRFKGVDKHRYVITKVRFRLAISAEPTLVYRDLNEALDRAAYERCKTSAEKLRYVRDLVLTVRRKKSMVLDPLDPNSRSAGSFFTNPIIKDADWPSLAERLSQFGDVPVYEVAGGKKLSAAWLVERAGFKKGQRSAENVGISANHALALVNHGGTTAALLALAASIQAEVLERFGIALTIEPEVLTP